MFQFDTDSENGVIPIGQTCLCGAMEYQGKDKPPVETGTSVPRVYTDAWSDVADDDWED